jgi:hypothetical protein
VQIDKQTIVDMFNERGDQDKAKQAEQQLPDKVDHEEHADLLSKLGVDTDELLKKAQSAF